MCTSLDVAAYILAKRAPLTTIKLQKLVYYAQAWSLVWDEQPLFRDRIETWASGPVIPRLYQAHKGQFTVRRVPGGDARKLNATQKETIDAVLAYYGRRSAQWLVDLTHKEQPWRSARGNLPPDQRSHNVISHESMALYYNGLISVVKPR
jgi:uncharacterized phage-associated protein